MNKIFIVIAVFLFFISCVTETPERYLIEFNDNTQTQLPLSSIFENCKFVRLQLSDNSLVGRRIGKIKKHNDMYYLSYDFKSLLVFDKNGNFIWKMESQGGGPGEYTMLTDYDVDSNGDVIVLDFKKLHKYGNNGVLKETIPLTICGFNIKVLENGNYLICASGEDYSVYLVDKNGQIKEKYLYINKMPTIGRVAPFIQFGMDSVLFQFEYSNSILCYDSKNELFSTMNLLSGNDFIDTKRTKKLKQEFGKDYLEYISSENTIGGIVAYTDYLFFSAGNRKNGFKCFFINIKNKKNTQYTITEKNQNDISFTDTYSLFNHLDKSDAKDCFISYIYMDKLIESLKTETKYSKNAHYLSLWNQFKDVENPEDENPVLIEFTIKEYINE